MLELKDFVSKTLVDVIEGIHEAQTNLSVSKKGYVVPVYNKLVGNDRLGISEQKIEFDIAVQVSESDSSGSKSSGELGVGGKIFVASAEGTITGESSKHEETSKGTVSRIKFNVPIGFKPIIEVNFKGIK